jgi:hypothetical protein
MSLLLSNRIERLVRDFRDKFLRKYNHEKLPDEIYNQDIPRLRISFCTTCMNRLFHLKETYLKNIKDNLEYKNVEFVLINYNSKDTLHEWAKVNLKKYIDAGIVNYYHTNEPQLFHASIAKNLAHKVATGDIVCNLDGDNFTGKDFAFYINYLYHKEGLNNLYHFAKAPFWGTEGRIVMSKKHFFELGGYDEALEPTGHEDHDLMDRAKAYGVKYHRIGIENFLHYLSNSTLEKVANVSDKKVDFYELESRNRETSTQNILNNKLKANPAGWGLVPLFKNFEEQSNVY